MIIIPILEMKKQNNHKGWTAWVTESWLFAEPELECNYDKLKSRYFSTASWCSHSEVHKKVLWKGRTCDTLKDDQVLESGNKDTINPKEWTETKYRRQAARNKFGKCCLVSFT